MIPSLNFEIYLDLKVQYLDIISVFMLHFLPTYIFPLH